MKRTALLLLAPLALAACVDNRSSLVIEGRLPPDSVPSCKFDGASTIFFTGPGVLDVALKQDYSLIVKVTNNLSDPKTVAPEAMQSAKDWYPEAARVVVNPSSYQGSYQPSPALLPVDTRNVTPVAGQTIKSAGGTAPIEVQAVSAAMGAQLAMALAAGEVRQVVLGISLQGVTADGAALQTNDWYFPLTVCSGCLAVPTCAAGQVLAPTSCFGLQDSPPVCVAPTTGG